MFEENSAYFSGSVQQIFEKLANQMSTNNPTNKQQAAKLLAKTVTEDLLNLDEQYLENCLLNLQENFVEKSQNTLLNENFFPNLQLEKLISLHSKMQEEFKLMKNDFEKILDIFQNHKEDFLIYCEILPWNHRLQEFIKEKVESNREIREEIDKLTKDSFHSKRNKDAQDSIVELLDRIPQALERYPNVLGSISKEAGIADLPTVEEKTQKARELMLKIKIHIDKCNGDEKNIDTIRKYEDSLSCYNCPLRSFGLLLDEVRDVEVRLKKGTDQFFKFMLLCFEEYLVAFKELELKKKVGSTEIQYHFIQTFQIEKFNEMNPLMMERILELNTYEEGTTYVDKRNSLEIRFATNDSRVEFHDRISECKLQIQKFKKLKPGNMHEGHKFKKVFNQYQDKVKIHKHTCLCILYHEYFCLSL